MRWIHADMEFSDGWYRSLSGTSADWYEPGAEASDNIYVDSVIIFL